MSDAPGLPDINAETYPFAAVEAMLDRAAFFNLYASGCGMPIVSRDRRATVGFALSDGLRRLSIVMSPPTARHGVRACNRIGEEIAHFAQRWMLAPDAFPGRPGVNPPETGFSPDRAQRFVMLDGLFRLAAGEDAFRGFGAGRTEPVTGGGDTVAAYAVGTIVEGFGRFRGCSGTYTCCGSLSPRGFRGSLLLRVTDPDGVFQSEWLEIPAADDPLPEPDATYLILSGHKAGSASRTDYLTDDAGDVVGLGVEQQLRLIATDCGAGTGGQIRCASSVGPIVGHMRARIGFNLLNPGAPGTADAPIPFKSYNEYVLVTPEGDELGRFDADGNEGRTFTLTLQGAPGQRALRFGGFGPILNGTSRFAGISGQMTDNSVVGLFPHAVATTYIFRVLDPSGAYRTDGPGSR